MIFSATENSKKKRILVADDSITIQKLVNVTFAGDDFEVITALDGFDAGTKVRRLKPEIVLIDTHLREVSGAQLLTEIRKDTTLLHTKVIMLKANLSDDEQQALIGLPYDLLLEKPFDSRKLSEAVRHLLQSENSTGSNSQDLPLRPLKASKLLAVTLNSDSPEDSKISQAVS